MHEVVSVQCWTGAETKALRQAMRLSIRAFAAYLGIDARTVNKWEARHTTITLRPHTQAFMDTALARAPEEVKTRFIQTVSGAQREQHANAAQIAAAAHDPQGADSRTPPSGNDDPDPLLPEEQPDVSKSHPGDSATQSPLGRIELIRRNLNKAITANTIATASLNDWEQAALYYGRAARESAPRVLLKDLSEDLVQLQESLMNCRSASALRRLARVAAHMAGLMCLTLIKMDERTPFRGWARTACLAANEAGDPLTHSWVRAQEAYGHYYSGDLVEAVHVAQHAQALSGQVPSAGAVLAAALEARAQAALGHQQETRSALGRAETYLSHLDASAIGTSAFQYNEAQLRFHEGNALTHLHDTSAAWHAQQMALNLCPVSDYMDRTMIQLDRANCLAYDGDITSAVVVMVEAATSLTDQQRQGIIATRIGQTIAILSPQHRALPAIRDLRDLLNPSPEAKG